MRTVGLVLVCLVVNVHGRYLPDQSEAGAHESDSVNALATLLLSVGDTAAAWQLAGHSTLMRSPAVPLRGHKDLIVRSGPFEKADVRMMADVSPLLARRSVVKYEDKPVPEDVTDRALEAAILAPNHFMSEPWRFYACGPETKEKLRGLNEEKRKIADGVPEMLVVTVSSEHDLSEKLGLEDHAAVAAAVQNFMLSLAADGVGSKWMTGALGAAPEDVLAAVDASEGEKLMGVIWYGYPAKSLEDTKAPPRKKGLDGVLKRLP